jgi:hypothetical protein
MKIKHALKHNKTQYIDTLGLTVTHIQQQIEQEIADYPDKPRIFLLSQYKDARIIPTTREMWKL